MNPDVEEFARALVREVRDRSVRGCDDLLRAKAASPTAKRWREVGLSVPSWNVAIPDIIDEVVFNLLYSIDEGLLRLKFLSSNGNEIDLTKEGRGELAGWYVGSGGWRSMFAEERFADDCADLRR